MEQTPVKHSRVRASERAVTKDIVYFLENLSSLTVKVGYTRNLAKRLHVLQTGNHNRLEVCAFINAPRAVERLIHDELANFKIRNEWFDHCACVDGLIRAIEMFEIEHGLRTGEYSPLVSEDDMGRIVANWKQSYPRPVDSAHVNSGESGD